MAQITASLVKELRERVGGGMLECKKALEEADGNIEKAIEVLRKSGAAKAEKKSGRTAAEGVIIVKCDATGKNAIMLEINCETDFVAKDTNFVEFAHNIAACGLDKITKSVDELLSLPYKAGETKTVSKAREDLVAKIGENITIRRMAFLQSQTTIGTYVHGNRIGVLVTLSTDNQELGKDIAMQIAAQKPEAINAEDLPQELLAKEKEIFAAQVKDSGKPPQIIQKMVEGKLQKFINEVTLTGQQFIKDPNTTIGELLKKANTKVLEFVRFEVGEGIEKEKTDFAKEVMEQVEGKK